MAINAFNLESASGVIHAATEMRSPIIRNSRLYFLPQGSGISTGQAAPTAL